MQRSAPKVFWRRCRRIFRRIRWTFWTLLILLIFALLYLNLIGLPGFAKRPLLEKLRARGIEAEFKNLRLSWYRGLVAYDVRFGQPQSPFAPQFTAERVQLALKGSELKRLDFQVGALLIYNARMAWPPEGTNKLVLEKINAQVRFHNNNFLQIDHFEARLATNGAKIQISGTLTNALALRSPPSLHLPLEVTPQPAAVQGSEVIQRIADAIAALKFTEPPVVVVDFTFDASNEQPQRIGVRTVIEQHRLLANAVLYPKNREFVFAVNSEFDLRRIRPLLPSKGAEWLGRFNWEQPPQIRLLGAVTLPAWTNAEPDKVTALLDTLRLDGEFKTGKAKYRGIAVQSAKARFLHTGTVWRLRDMQLSRPEGVLHLEHWTDEANQDYYWHARGFFDPEAVRPLLNPLQKRGLDRFTFTTTPQIDAEIWSRWHEPERTGLKAQLVVSNFTYRGESISRLETGITYTNLWLKFVSPQIERGSEWAVASSVDADFREMLVYLTNCQANIKPGPVTRCIGPKTARTMKPYQFLAPVRARVDGMVSITNSHISDLRFELAGGPFHWWKFNVPFISGTITWKNQSLLLTNVTADFYGGSLEGTAAFDFTPAVGDDFHFDLTTTNANLSPLLADLGSHTNNLEGLLNSRLVVTHANTKDMQSWQGFGEVQLREGLLWEIPIFGVFAPALNAIFPNLGSGRASDGSGTFTITNSVISTSDLQLRSPAMRIQYRGTVDFDGNLNARAEAELLRSTAFIGPVVSTMFWPVSKLFEYKIGGDLSHPETQPVYIPQALLAPLHPFRTLKNIFSDTAKTSNDGEKEKP